MTGFNNRIAAQRDILVCVNGKNWSEELYGLSSGAIERWMSVNDIKPDSVLVKLVKESAEKLFFLSNKSQEQITDDYKMLSSKVSVLTKRIQQEMSCIK
ncbi:hypothetical protein BMR02_14735 [Methylococcaceae bacterium HT1]|nr:hypothetical protein BMR02_14735 [Methylococcaceae bacterium HT1]TXL13186.1 hypothetical protein BMR04_14570 [Methylococcaceae bacterium HT3]TXL16506.1 hypothetical protein BMR06_15710 [Methylococcaceae bacterium HT5]